MKKWILGLLACLFLATLFIFMIPVFIIVFSITLVLFGALFCYQPTLLTSVKGKASMRFLGVGLILVGAIFLLGGDSLFSKVYDHNDQSKYIRYYPYPPHDVTISPKEDPPDAEALPPITQRHFHHFNHTCTPQ